MHALEVGCDVHTAMALLELGSVRWMAPEIYDAELIGKERGSPSAEADCHSFGMLILEVHYPHPFTSRPDFLTMDSVCRSFLVRSHFHILPRILW